MLEPTIQFENLPEEDDESDISNLTPDDIRTLTVGASDWTTETLLSQLRRGNVRLDPKFQRRDVWNYQRKSAFIESLILNFPIPQIVLAESDLNKNRYIVIDGKQRLLTLRQFTAQPEEPFSSFKLEKLQVMKHLNGLAYHDLEENAALNDELTFFQNSTIRTVVLKNWKKEALLHLVFLRINTGSVPLSPQELRQVLVPGEFVDFVEEYSGMSSTIHQMLGTDGPDRRMRDAELLVRFFALTTRLDHYTGNMKAALDETCREYNTAWASSEARIRETAQSCEYAIVQSGQVFGERAFRRWSGRKWETGFNRAVFDALTYYFWVPEIAERSIEQKGDVVAAFKRLCDRNRSFRESIFVTTKSLTNTHARIALWGKALSTATGLEFSIPRLVAGRIVAG